MKNKHYFPCQLIDTGFDYRVGINSENASDLAQLFEKNGIRANGKSWEQLVKFIVNSKAPNMAHVIDYESDEKGLETSLRNKKDQLKVAEIIHHSCKDSSQLQRMLEKIKI